MSDPIRVLLADDHPALRVGLRVLLDREPDIAVLDCQLPGRDGVTVAAELRRRESPVLVLALSAYDDDRYLAGMAEAGAVGYLLKSEAPGQIVAAVQAVMRGMVLWTPEQLTRIRNWRAEVARRRESLTGREREMLQLIAGGLSNKEIAQQLHIAVRTADFHVSNILRKLEVISRVKAAVWAVENRE